MRVAVACFLVMAALALAACQGDVVTSAAGASTSRPSDPSSPADSGTSSATASAVIVSDSTGSTFDVSASPVIVTVAVTVNSFVWSAAPGQEFLADTLTVKNPTGTVEPLSDFDDLTSGLASDVAFVMSSTNASSSGFLLDCGIDPLYPATVCPVSYGQGLTVDSDSADHDDGSASLSLAPGSTAQITLSYGPVLDSLTATMVSSYFDGGVGAPTDLTP